MYNMNEGQNINNPVIIPWYLKKWGKVAISMGVLIIILVIALFVLFTKVLNAPKISDDITTILTEDSLVKSEKRMLIERLDRPRLGNISANLVIVEFADFQCPACKKEFPIIREVVNRHLDDVLYIYRSYPVINDASSIISEASLCASEQGKFWQMHDRLFIDSDLLSDITNLNTIAQRAGLDINRFSQCVISGKYASWVSEDMNLAYDLGALGTPTFFINGHKVQGVVSGDQWESLIAKYKTLAD
jgi:protein-disulfide isomerase